MHRSLALLAVLSACGKHASDEDEDHPVAAAVTCKPAESAMIEDTVEVTGVIAPPPKLDSVVSSPVAGRVGQVAVEEGDRVEAGALLAVIDDPALPAGSVEARAGVATAQAAKAAADLELARQDRLVTAGIGARKDLDEARAKAAAAAAELEAANARSGLASKQLQRRELRAPRAGIVLHVWKRVGENVEASTSSPVAEVADLSVLEIHAQVPPTALAPIRDGMAASAHALGVEAQLEASVVRVAPAVDPATMLGTVRLAIDPKSAEGKGVKVGAAATAQIVIAKRPGIRVPATALRRSTVGADEAIVCEGSVARVRPVTIGKRIDGAIEVASGLKAGEQVVVDHVLGLEDGQALKLGGDKGDKPGSEKGGD